MVEPASLRAAARHFGVDPSTVRRWIREGAPCVEPGSAGRTHGARVDLVAVARWRAARLGVVDEDRRGLLPTIQEAILGTLRRDGRNGRPVWLDLGIAPGAAAALLADAYARIARALNPGTND
jgi:hypothetical protein